jgi:hypothetical protein
MRKKRILMILRDKDLRKNKRSHFHWAKDCVNDYDFDYWGKDITSTSLKSLKRTIDYFKPDYIYMTIRKKYEKWLPDLTSIKVPKIFVEVDVCYYNVNDSWYKQFDKLLCREPSWNGWNNIPLFRWSVPEKAFPLQENKRSGIYFIGRTDGKAYTVRRELKSLLGDRIGFLIKYSSYWEFMKTSSALVCPTNNDFGNYTPTKLFEYLASGSAVITNCDFNMAGIPEMEKFVIKYTDIKDLESKLSMDFVPFHNKAIESMRNHTHRIRYRELFG